MSLADGAFREPVNTGQLWFSPPFGLHIIPAHSARRIDDAGNVFLWCGGVYRSIPGIPTAAEKVVKPWDGRGKCRRCEKEWVKAHQIRLGLAL